MSPLDLRNRWIAAGLEPQFIILGPDDPETQGKWGVMDAECEFVARCDTREMAEIVADAMTSYDREMWAIPTEDTQ